MDEHPELLPPGETSVERFRESHLSVRREYDQATDAYEGGRRWAGPSKGRAGTGASGRAMAELEPWGHIVNDAATDHKFRSAARNGFVAIFWVARSPR
jgi:hypothetical protein